MQQQTPTQALQPASSTPISTISKVGTSTLYRLGWQQVVLAIGLLAISGVGTALVFKKAIIPRLKSWIRKVVSEEDEESKSISKPSLAEEAAAAAKSGAAADVARVNQDMLILKNGGSLHKFTRSGCIVKSAIPSTSHAGPFHSVHSFRRSIPKFQVLLCTEIRKAITVCFSL